MASRKLCTGSRGGCIQPAAFYDQLSSHLPGSYLGTDIIPETLVRDHRLKGYLRCSPTFTPDLRHPDPPPVCIQVAGIVPVSTELASIPGAASTTLPITGPKDRLLTTLVEFAPEYLCHFSLQYSSKTTPNLISDDSSDLLTQICSILPTISPISDLQNHLS